MTPPPALPRLTPSLPPPSGPGAEFTIIEPLCAVFRRTLKGVGLKYTPERAMILEAVITRGEADGVFEAETLIRDLAARAPTPSSRAAPPDTRSIRVSKATVYRTLKLLADAGIVQQVLFNAEQAHYQLAYGRGTTGLFMDMDTGQAETIEVPELEEIVRQACAAKGVAVEGHRLLIFGRRPVGTTTTGAAKKPGRGKDQRRKA